MAKPTKEDAKDIVAKLLASKVLSREDIADLTDQSPLDDVTEMYHTLMCRFPHGPGDPGQHVSWCGYYTTSGNNSREEWREKVRNFFMPYDISYKDMLTALQEIAGILSTIEGSDNKMLIDKLLGEYYKQK